MEVSSQNSIIQRILLCDYSKIQRDYSKVSVIFPTENLKFGKFYFTTLIFYLIFNVSQIIYSIDIQNI